MKRINPAIQLVEFYNQAKSSGNEVACSDIERVVGASIEKFGNSSKNKNVVSVFGFLAYINDEATYRNAFNAVRTQLDYLIDDRIANAQLIIPFICSPMANKINGSEYEDIITKTIENLQQYTNFDECHGKIILTLDFIIKLLLLILNQYQHATLCINSQKLLQSQKLIEKISAGFDEKRNVEIRTLLHFIDVLLRQFTQNKTYTTAINEKAQACAKLLIHIAAAAAEAAVLAATSELALLPFSLWAGAAAIDSMIDCKDDIKIIFSKTDLRSSQYESFSSLATSLILLHEKSRLFKSNRIPPDEFYPIANTCLQELNNNFETLVRHKANCIYIVICISDIVLMQHLADLPLFLSLIGKIQSHIIKHEKHKRDVWLFLLYKLRYWLNIQQSPNEQTVLDHLKEFFKYFRTDLIDKGYKNHKLYRKLKAECHAIIQVKKHSVAQKANLLNPKENTLQRKLTTYLNADQHKTPATLELVKLVDKHYAIYANNPNEHLIDKTPEQEHEIALNYDLFVRRDWFNYVHAKTSYINPRPDDVYLTLQKYPDLPRTYFARSVSNVLFKNLDFQSKAMNFHFIQGASGSGKSMLAADVLQRVAHEAVLNSHTISRHIVWWFKSTPIQDDITPDEIWFNQYIIIADRLNVPSSKMRFSKKNIGILLNDIYRHISENNFCCVFCFDDVKSFNNWLTFHLLPYGSGSANSKFKLLVKLPIEIVLVMHHTFESIDTSSFPATTQCKHYVTNVDCNKSYDYYSEYAKIFLAMYYTAKNPDIEGPIHLREHIDLFLTKIDPCNTHHEILDSANAIVKIIPLVTLWKFASMLLNKMQRLRRKDEKDLFRQLVNDLNSRSNTIIHNTRIKDTAINLLKDRHSTINQDKKMEDALKKANAAKSLLKRLLKMIESELLAQKRHHFYKELFPFINFLIDLKQESIDRTFLHTNTPNHKNPNHLLMILQENELISLEDPYEIALEQFRDRNDPRIARRRVSSNGSIRLHKITSLFLSDIINENKKSNLPIDEMINYNYETHFEFFKCRMPIQQKSRLCMLETLISIEKNINEIKNEPLLLTKLFLMIAISYWDSSEYNKAIVYFRRAETLESKANEKYKNIANKESKESKESKETNEYAKNMIMLYSYVHLCLGIAYKTVGQYDIALKQQKIAASLYHNHEKKDLPYEYYYACHNEFIVLSMCLSQYTLLKSTIDILPISNLTNIDDKNSSHLNSLKAQQGYWHKFINYKINNQPIIAIDKMGETNDDINDAANNMLMGIYYFHQNILDRSKMHFNKATTIYHDTYNERHIRLLWGMFWLNYVNAIVDIKNGKLDIRSDRNFQNFYAIIQQMSANTMGTTLMLERVIMMLHLTSLVHFCNHKNFFNLKHVFKNYYRTLEWLNAIINYHKQRQPIKHLFLRKLYSMQLYACVSMKKIEPHNLRPHQKTFYLELDDKISELEKNIHWCEINYQERSWNILSRLWRNDIPCLKLTEVQGLPKNDSNSRPNIYIPDYGIY